MISAKEAYFIKNGLNEQFEDPRIDCDFSIFSLEPFQLLLHVHDADMDELSTEIRYGLSRKIRSQLHQLDAKLGGTPINVVFVVSAPLISDNSYCVILH
ncbi:MAG: hypothetical protein WBV68_13865 [Exiguobacterium oxidotolerans]|uniref:hypothetical protein n=1 Tax=Exiguobacterium oxidotolerans TaxID=223958 RepID=UPI0004943E04|nr:hypothetical protein [Exiguobacterium oxidotolerans]